MKSSNCNSMVPRG